MKKNTTPEADMELAAIVEAETSEIKPRVFDLSALPDEEFTNLISSLYIDPSEKYEEPEAIVAINGKTLFYRGGLYAVGGAAGTRKTTLLTLLTSIICGRDESEHGVTAPRPQRVLYLDTEQHKHSTQKISLRVERLCGIAAREQLEVYSVKSLSPDQIKAFIERTLIVGGHARKPFDCVIIDNWTDCMEKPNDEDQSILLTRQTRQLAEFYNVAVIGLCHTNEGGATNKLRGHAGSELMRRADLVILLSDKGEFSEISYPKKRDLCPDKFWVTYSPEGLPCFYDNTEAKATPASNPDKYASIVAKIPEGGWDSQELKREIIKRLSTNSAKKMSDKTAEGYVTKMSKVGVVLKHGGRYYKPVFSPSQAEESEETLPF